MSGVQKVESRGDRVPNGPSLGGPSAHPGPFNPGSVARALPVFAARVGFCAASF